jgi:hypothetical protein
MHIRSLQKKTLPVLLSLMLLLALLPGAAWLSACTAPAGQGSNQAAGSDADGTTTAASAEPLPHNDSPEDRASYLKQYFGISLTDGVTESQFVDALLKVQPATGLSELAPTNGSAPLTSLVAIRYAVIGANLEEVALVYGSERASDTLTAANLASVDEEFAPYVAVALETGLLEPALASVEGALAPEAPVTVDLASALVMNAADHNGTSRSFIGYSSDPDIYGELINVYEELRLYDDEYLSNIGIAAVTNQVTTGYSLKDENYAARFLPDRTLRYGHSNITHMQQLLALLNNEGLIAKVQIEPKVSVYEYLLEWGEPPTEPSPTYEVRKISDELYLAYAIEFDVALEFESAAAFGEFNGLIEQYAKKNSGEEGKSLLLGSWWQPLYFAQVSPGSEYVAIVDNVIRHEGYSVHSFCLAEKAVEVLASFMALDAGMDIQQEDIWVDAPFYRYLNGESE